MGNFNPIVRFPDQSEGERRYLTLLLVEDNPAHVFLLREMLDEAQELDCKITEATRLDKAMQLARLQQFDIILLDLNLPDTRGCAAVARLHASVPHVPIVVLSSSSDKATALEALRYGAQDYLTKDRLDPDALTRSIQYALTRFQVENLERMDAVVQAADAAIYGVDLRDRITNWNRAAEAMFGYSTAEAMGRSIILLDIHTQQGGLQQLLDRTRAGEHIDGYETEHLTRQGRRIDLALTLSPIKDRADKIVGVSILARDVSERKKAEAALRESEDRYHSLFAHSLDAIILSSVDGQILAVNPAALKMFKMSEEELKQHNYDALIDGADLRRAELFEQRITPGAAQGELTMRRGDGSLFPAEISVAAFHDRAGKLHISMFVHDITEQKKSTEELIYRAFYDQLTSLPNRALLFDRLDRLAQHANRDKTQRFAVLFVDVDRFKLINDSLGHAAGDQLLNEIAARLRECVRANDTVARLGGDEFTILLDDIAHSEAATLTADRIQNRLKQPFYLADHEVFITVSVGIAFSTPSHNDAANLLRDADTAMYEAKTTGRARYVIFDDEMHKIALQTLELEAALRRAVEHEEFVVHYQPIVGLESGQVEGFEALVRWRADAIRTQVAPGEFIPLAEETGLIIPIDWWVLKQACHKLKAQHVHSTSDSPCWVSVNFSAKQFANPAFVEEVERVLQTCGLSAKYLRLEITESAFMAEAPALMTTFARLRELGVQLYLDDFGTGYSSLGYLHRLPIDALKVDRSFVSGLDASGVGSEIVQATINMAHSMGLPVVAEGVQTEEQLLLLRLLGCDNAQGFYFAKPMPEMTLDLDWTEFIAEYQMQA